MIKYLDNVEPCLYAQCQPCRRNGEHVGDWLDVADLDRLLHWPTVPAVLPCKEHGIDHLCITDVENAPPLTTSMSLEDAYDILAALKEDYCCDECDDHL